MNINAATAGDGKQGATKHHYGSPETDFVGGGGEGAAEYLAPRLNQLLTKPSPGGFKLFGAIWIKADNTIDAT